MQRDAPVVELLVGFGPGQAASPSGLPGFDETARASAGHWTCFWNRGGRWTCPAATTPAPEPERRVILSQHLTAIHCAGSLTPQETGLTARGWDGDGGRPAPGFPPGWTVRHEGLSPMP